MNKKITKLKRKGFINIICYFIEFFLLSSVYTSSLSDGKLYRLIIDLVPIIGKEILFASSLSLIILSTSLRVCYANYLNKKIGRLEYQDQYIDSLEKCVNKKVEEVSNNYRKSENLDYQYSNTLTPEKKFVKVYKK